MSSYSLGSLVGNIVIGYNGGGVGLANAGLKSLSDNSGAAGKAVAATATVAAGAGGIIAAGLVYAANKAADFEQKMSAVKAVTGATGPEMDTLSQKALEIGKNTSFSASQAADAIGELAKAGVSIPDIMNGAADATVALAAAGEIDLPQAATIASNAMNQFSLSAQDLPRVADLIAGAANASAIDVGQFGYSLSQVGAVAKVAGLSFDDTAVAIAELGNAGIVGSDAGTSLKTMLNNLQPSTKQTKALFDELGITTDGMNNKFYDAQGNLKSFGEVSQVLQDALKGMTQAQKQSTLETLFGSDAIRAGAVFSEQGAAGFDKMSAAMGKVSAADVAATRLDNLNGKIEGLKGSVETVAIQVGTALLPALRGLVDGATNAVNGLGDMAPKIGAAFNGIMGFLKGDINLDFAKAFGLDASDDVVQKLLTLRDAVVNGLGNVIGFLKDVGAAVGDVIATVAPLAAEIGGALVMAFSMLSNLLAPLGTALRAVTGFLREHGTTVRAVGVAILAAVVAVKAYNIATKLMALVTTAVRGAIISARVAMWLLNAAFAANPIGIIIVALIALAAGFAYLWTHSESFRNFWIGLWKTVSGAVMTAVRWVVNAAKNTWGWIEKYIVDPVVKAWNAVYGWFQKAYDWVSNIIGTIVNWIKDHWGLILSFFIGPVGLVIQYIVEHFDQIKTIVMNVVNAIVNFVQAVWGKIKDWIINPIVAAYNYLIATWTTIYNYLVGIVTTIVNWIMQKWQIFVTSLQLIWTTVSNGITNAWNAIYGFISGIVTTIVDWIVQKWTIFIASLELIWTTVKNGVTNLWNAVWSFISGIINTIVNWVVTRWTQFKAALDLIWTSVKTAVTNAWNAINSFLAGIVNSIYNTVSSKVTAIKNFANAAWTAISNAVTTAWNTIKTTFTNAITSVVTSVTGIKDKIVAALSGALSLLVDTGKNIIDGLWNGIKQGIDGLVGKVKGALDTVKNTITGVFDIFSPSRWMMWIGDMLTAGLGIGVEHTMKNNAIDPVTDMARLVMVSTQAEIRNGIDPAVNAAGEVMGGTSVLTNDNSQNPKTTNITFNTYNPAAEKAADSEARRMRGVAGLGLTG